MSTLDSPEMMRAVIMDHYEYPRNKKLKGEVGYLKVHMDSESCIDDIYIEALIENGIIKDVCFDGIGCTISTASTSIMSELLQGKTIEEGNKIIDNYYAMIHEKPYDPELLDEAVVFMNTSRQPSRIKCATISFRGVRRILTGGEEDE
jgi:nitrogen fixation NifU-like protein